ncbi:MAG: glycosyltransferase family 4 protein [Planctomycetota bacterium]
MKILFIQKVKGLYGSERVLLHLVAGLAARGHSVTFLVYTAPCVPVDGYCALLRQAGAVVITMILGHCNPAVLWRTRRLIRAGGFDVVHTHLIHGDWYGITAARWAGVRRVISTKHNDDPFRGLLPFRVMERFMARRCAAITAVSEWVRAFHARLGLPAIRVIVIPHGIAPAAPDPGARARVCAEFGIGADEVVLLCAARLTEQKGQHLLIRAFGRLAASGRRGRLLIAGTGPDEAGLRHQVAEAGLAARVLFLGYRDDITALMAAADVYVQPSLWEGFGFVFLEAMQAGLPILSSNVSAIPEVVVHGETGYLLPAGDVSGIWGHMQVLVDDAGLRARMGAAAQARVARRFSLEAMVGAYEDLYRRVAAGERS